MNQLELNKLLSSHKEWLDGVPDGKRLKLYNLDANGLTFSPTPLKDSILVRAKLRGARFDNCDLTDADMRYADLRESSFLHANLKGVCLAYADLSNADMEGVNLTLASMRNAKLFKTDLSCADLSKANFDGADLRQADLSDATFVETNLRDVNVEGVDFKNVVFNQVDLHGTKLKNAKLIDSQWINCKGMTEEKFIEIRKSQIAGESYGNRFQESLAANTLKVNVEYLTDEEPEVRINLYEVKRGVWYFDLEFDEQFEVTNLTGSILESGEIVNYFMFERSDYTLFNIHFVNFHYCIFFCTIDKRAFRGTIYDQKEYAAMIENREIVTATT